MRVFHRFSTGISTEKGRIFHFPHTPIRRGSGKITAPEEFKAPTKGRVVGWGSGGALLPPSALAFALCRARAGILSQRGCERAKSGNALFGSCAPALGLGSRHESLAGAAEPETAAVAAGKTKDLRQQRADHLRYMSTLVSMQGRISRSLAPTVNQLSSFW